jgi:hypothetical protein
MSPAGDVERMMKPQFICDCGTFVSHRLDTIGVHQMPETNPKWDVNSMVKFLQLEEIIKMDDC